MVEIRENFYQEVQQNFIREQQKLFGSSSKKDIASNINWQALHDTIIWLAGLQCTHWSCDIWYRKLGTCSDKLCLSLSCPVSLILCFYIMHWNVWEPPATFSCTTRNVNFIFSCFYFHQKLKQYPLRNMVPVINIAQCNQKSKCN